MAENYIKCEIRKARRQKEFKNTNVIVENIVLRDYDNIKHDNEILPLMLHIYQRLKTAIKIMFSYQ